MATRKTKPLEEELPDPSQEELDLYDFIEEMGGSISVVDVFRVGRDGSMPHVDRVTMDAIREDVYSYLRSLGVGKYCLQFKSADRQIRRRRTIEVADKAPAAQVPATTNGQPDHTQFMREQMALQQTLIMGLVSALGNNKPVMPDLGFLAGVLKPPDLMPVVTLMSAMINRKEPEGGGLALAKTIVEMSRDLAPDGGGNSDSLWGAVKEVGGTLVKSLSLPPGPVPVYTEQTATGSPAVPPPVNRLPPPAIQTHTEEPVRVTAANFQQWLRAGLVQLKQKAAQGKDIPLTIEWVLENPEEPQWAAVAGAVEQGATFENLLTFDPEIAQSPVLRAWFKDFYDGLHSEIFNPVDTAGEGGDPNDPGNNAGPGPTGPPSTGNPPVG